MKGITVTFPSWIGSLPPKDQGRAKYRFLLQVAAILATEKGSISGLSQRIGMHKNTLNTMVTSGQMDNGIPVKVIKAIEQIIGVGVLPRQLMNPTIYDEQ